VRICGDAGPRSRRRPDDDRRTRAPPNEGRNHAPHRTPQHCPRSTRRMPAPSSNSGAVVRTAPRTLTVRKADRREAGWERPPVVVPTATSRGGSRRSIERVSTRCRTSALQPALVHRSLRASECYSTSSTTCSRASTRYRCRKFHRRLRSVAPMIRLQRRDPSTQRAPSRAFRKTRTCCNLACAAEATCPPDLATNSTLSGTPR
jgi:hypothetical protein